MVRKTVHRAENNYLLLQPAMLETRLQTPHDGAEDGAAPYAGDAGIALVAGEGGVRQRDGGGRKVAPIPIRRK